MLLFANSNRNVLVSRSLISSFRLAFQLQALDRYVTLLVTRTTVQPSPAYQVHGSLGGLNYLNVFGEEPVTVSLSGIVAGASCATLQGVQSALGIGVDVFRELGVVENALPLQYRVGTSRMRSAYLVAMDITQQEAFSDVANFNMRLLSEPFSEASIPTIVDVGTPNPSPTLPGDDPSGGADPDEVDDLTVRPATGSSSLSRSAPVTVGGRGDKVSTTVTSPASQLLASNGEVLTPSVAAIVSPGFGSPSQGRA